MTYLYIGIGFMLASISNRDVNDYKQLKDWRVTVPVVFAYLFLWPILLIIGGWETWQSR